MKRLLLLLIIICFIIFSFAVIHNKLSIKDNILVVGIVNETRSSAGTGFFVSDNIIVTAGHIIKDSNDFTIFYNNTTYKAVDSYLFDPNIADVGVIVVDTNEVEHDVVLSKAVKGEYIHVRGAPYTLLETFEKGRVKNTHVINLSMKMDDLIYIDCDVYPGNSGSPVINKKGEIIGLIIYRRGKFVLATSHKYIKECLKGRKVNYASTSHN